MLNFSDKNVVMTWGAVATVFFLFSSFFVYKLNFKNISDKETSASETLITQQRPIDGNSTNFVDGTVSNVANGKIFIKGIEKFSAKHIQYPSNQLETMTIRVDSTTVIERIILKDQAVIDDELAKSKKKTGPQESSSSTSTAVGLEPFNRVKIDIGDVKIGDTILVTTYWDISSPRVTEITAAKIDVMPTQVPTKPISAPSTQ